MVIASPSESRCHLTLELRIPRPPDPKGEIHPALRKQRNISSRQSMSLRLPEACLCGTWAEETVDHRGSPRCLQRNAGCKLLQEAHSLSDVFLTYDEVVRLQEERICTQRNSSPMPTLVVDRAKRRTKRCERGICDRAEDCLRKGGSRTRIIIE